jgi:hypothetical protein
MAASTVMMCGRRGQAALSLTEVNPSMHQRVSPLILPVRTGHKPVDFFVSPNADDSGTQEKPLDALESIR